MEPLPNGQYGIVADSKENTAMVKSYIATIINANETLKSQWKVYKDVIRNIETGQEIHVYPYKEAALQGKHFHVLIGDEIHVWRDDAVWKAGTSGQAKIWNAVTIGITTAGSSRDGFLVQAVPEAEARQARVRVLAWHHRSGQPRRPQDVAQDHRSGPHHDGGA